MGYSREQVVLIPNGLRQAEPELPLDLALPSGRSPVIGFIGRLDPQKGPDLAVRCVPDVLAILPSAQLVIIGSGVMRPALVALTQSLGVAESISFRTIDEGACAALEQFDVLIVPSRYEGGPYVPLEAMHRGVPVVLTDVVGNCDLSWNGNSAVMVAPEDPRALGAGIVEALRPERSAALRAAGKQMVESRHSWSVMQRDTSALYGSVLMPPAGRR